MDIKGANVFMESLQESGQHQPNSNKLARRASRKASRSIEPYLWNPDVSSQPVESILVCTGVYNPQNDMLYHLRKLIKNRESSNQSSSIRNLNSLTTSMTLASDDKAKMSGGDANNNIFMGHSDKSSKSSSATEVALAPLTEQDEENQKTIRPNNNSYPRCLFDGENGNGNGGGDDDLNEVELTAALSRRNSFISYFDDHQNVPDHTFDNLKFAVDYVLESLGLMQRQ